jgi:hypothetical protein
MMSFKEGVKDFTAGIATIALGLVLCAVLVILWPFIALAGWIIIILILLALALALFLAVVMIIGRLVRGGSRQKGPGA